MTWKFTYFFLCRNNFPLILLTVAVCIGSNPVRQHTLSVQAVSIFDIFNVKESLLRLRYSPASASRSVPRGPQEDKVSILALIGLVQLLLEQTVGDPVVDAVLPDDPVLAAGFIQRYVAPFRVVAGRTHQILVHVAILDRHTSRWGMGQGHRSKQQSRPQ
uniref:(northern house mosquito) hypothetical protein n=1 Tax=Culex pipiens TaxID=7175 RepID=A0A8D8BPW9_CULPI